WWRPPRARAWRARLSASRGGGEVSGEPTGFEARLGLLDATALVAGSVIGSGIFIVSADIARRLPAPGWLLAVWAIAGALTVAGALTYGHLAAAMPRAGGQYVYLTDLWGPLWGFLYGWTLVLVIQTGTIAAVAVAFATYAGQLWPAPRLRPASASPGRRCSSGRRWSGHSSPRMRGPTSPSPPARCAMRAGPYPARWCSARRWSACFI